MTSRIRPRRAMYLTAVAFLSVLSLSLLGGIAAAYNNSYPQCGKWPNGNPVGVQWKWGSAINQSGWWAYAFATYGEPTWDNYFTKIELGYNSSAEGEYDVINDTAMPPGYNWNWCHIFTTTLADFRTVGNVSSSGYPDNQSNSNMNRTAGHEIGHSLGFGHSDYNAIMYGASLYQGSWPTADDAAGISAMYP